ncbi:MAG: PP2C family protein-serine/threonine phosphatase [Spirochaetota bacterium]
MKQIDKKTLTSDTDILGAKLRALKVTNQSLSPLNKAKRPLVLKIIVVFFLFSLAQVMFVWLSIGSNQIRLIGDKALAMSNKITSDFASNVQTALKQNNMIEGLLSGKSNGENAESLTREHWNSLMTSIAFPVSTLELLSPEGIILFSSNKDHQNNTTVDNKTLQHIVSALQMSDLAGSRVYATPEVFDYSMQVYIPMALRSGTEVILHAAYPLPFVQKELTALLRFGTGIVVVTALLQIVFGFFVYRLVVRPVKTLEYAVAQVAAGDLAVRAPKTNHHDEIENLTTAFNGMVAALDEKTLKLEDSIRTLEQNRDLLQLELTMAKDIQTGFLPEAIASRHLKGFGYYRPLGEVSGDYYDIFPLDGNRTGVVLMDVSGHGVPAALITVMARSLFRSLSMEYADPAELMTEANTALFSNIKTDDYLTAFYFTIDDHNFFSYCNAGHTSGILLRQDGNAIPLDSTGFFIGAIDDLPLPLRTVRMQLKAGDRILLYTDGLTEAQNSEGELYTMERLIKSASEASDKSLEELHAHALSEFHKYLGRETLRDDVTLLAFEIQDSQS